ncbi:MAG: LacI family DNA-binding transcriptional regulator [Sphaerochaeta sp.]|nr:LacI family DNA-binding transcriptional regulator [Sphaerochaeta sp.]
MAITIIDVAKEAQVSKSTVSLVINNDPAVRDETRDRVLAAIKKLGYVVNYNARGLSGKRTHMIGVVFMAEGKSPKSYEFDQETEVFGHDVSIGLPQGLEGSDYGLMTERYFTESQGKHLPRLAEQNRTDGLILIGGLFSDALIEELISLHIPTVIVGKTHPLVDSVCADYQKGVSLGVDHLLATGHRRIGFINCPPLFYSHPLRRRGWDAAITRLGNSGASYVVNAETNTGKGGFQAMDRLLATDPELDGVVTANDGLALGVERYLLTHSIALPDTISLVSFEDSILSGYAAVPITTVSFDKEEMGAMAARLIVKRIEEPHAPPTHLMMDVALNQRSSVLHRGP